MFSFLLGLFFQNTVYAETVNSVKIDNESLKLEKVLETNDVIWGFDFLDDNEEEIVFSKRDGELVLYNTKTKKMISLKGVPAVNNNSQGGLLDVLFDKKNKNLYLTFSCPVKKEITTCLFRGKIDSNSGVLTGQIIFEAKALSSNKIHYGSRLLLTDRNELFMTIGERNERDLAQSLTVHNGKVLRLTLEGKPYEGNPFGAGTGLAEIYSYGYRNPQGIAQNINGDILECEFGPRGGDEINLIKPGLNYGWPQATYGSEYWGPKIGKNELKGMKAPLVYWVPSISPSGMMIYKSNTIKSIKGNVFLANLAGSHVRRIVFDDQYKVLKQESYLANLEDRFRQIKESPKGNIYLSTDSGIIYKISPL